MYPAQQELQAKKQSTSLHEAISFDTVAFLRATSCARPVPLNTKVVRTIHRTVLQKNSEHPAPAAAARLVEFSLMELCLTMCILSPIGPPTVLTN